MQDDLIRLEFHPVQSTDGEVELGDRAGVPVHDRRHALAGGAERYQDVLGGQSQAVIGAVAVVGAVGAAGAASVAFRRPPMIAEAAAFPRSP